MDYAATKLVMQRCFPSLFPTEDDVLHHLFFVNGCGYEWVGGQLVNPEDGKDPRKVIQKILRKRLTDCQKSLSGENSPMMIRVWKRRIEEIDEPWEAQAAREIERRRELAQSDNISYISLLPDGQICREVYPICKYAQILNVPDDVQPDWLDAARRAIAMVRTERWRLSDRDQEWVDRAERNLSHRFGQPA
jgi:hypothetical protein